jgi:hypothetical protein
VADCQGNLHRATIFCPLCAAELFWVFADAGFFWRAILFFLTWADYLTRYNFA